MSTKKKRFNELTDKDISYIHAIASSEMSHAEKMDMTCAKFGGITDRTVRNWWKELGITTKTDYKAFNSYADKILPDDKDMYLVFSAQNNTLANAKVIQSMENWADHWRSQGKTVEIVGIPSTYRNPTTIEESQKYASSIWWDGRIEKYLYYGSYTVGDVLISADTPVRPTTKNPTNGFEYLADGVSAIIGHPRISTRPMARMPKHHKLRTLSSTGFITHKNYSRSSAGHKARKHHQYGFMIVENNHDGTCMIPRNVKVHSDGNFCDLIFQCKDGVVTEIPHFNGVVWGDIHHEVVNQFKVDATLRYFYNRRVKATILHDLYDGARINPHEEKDTYIKRRKIVLGQYDVKEEVDTAVNFAMILALRPEVDEVYCTESNHDVFLDRYIQGGNWKNDLHNSPYYLEYALIQQTTDLTKYGNIFGYILTQKSGGRVKYLPYGSSLVINDRELALHGDNGINGARGSLLSFRKTNRKYTMGHVHSGQMVDNVTYVGSSCHLNQYYTRKGLSTSDYSDDLLHPNGKNQLVKYDEFNDYKITNLY